MCFLYAAGCLDGAIFSALDVESLLGTGDPGEARIQNSFSRGEPCQGNLFCNEIFMSAGSLLTRGQPGFFPHAINLLAGLLRRHLALTAAHKRWPLLEKTYYF